MGNPPQPASVDPLVTWTWPDAGAATNGGGGDVGGGSSARGGTGGGHTTANFSQLEQYTVERAVAAVATPDGGGRDVFLGVDSLLTGGNTTNVTVVGCGASLRIDWGVERAAWFEFDSPDAPAGGADGGVTIEASLSEFTDPYPHKTQPPKRYNTRGGGDATTTTFRLETNPQLFEGLRFVWLYVHCAGSPAADGTASTAADDETMAAATAAASSSPPVWHISAARVVAQAKPVGYTSRFSSPNDVVTRAWWSGAYGVRLNMLSDVFGSILVERGDRVSIQVFLPPPPPRLAPRTVHAVACALLHVSTPLHHLDVRAIAPCPWLWLPTPIQTQGDGHPTMAAALAAFGGTDTYQMVWGMLNRTDSGCTNCSRHVIDSGIMSCARRRKPLAGPHACTRTPLPPCRDARLARFGGSYATLWTMSVNDWFWASGNTSGLRGFAADQGAIVDNFATSPHLGIDANLALMGWDDRLGNGWCGPSTCPPEAQLAFVALLIRAARDLGEATAHAGLPSRAEHFHAVAANLTTTVRSWASWPHGWGLHAASHAINAGVVSGPDREAEEAALLSRLFNDSVTICSWSPFNTYWILQARACMRSRTRMPPHQDPTALPPTRPHDTSDVTTTARSRPFSRRDRSL